MTADRAGALQPMPDPYRRTTMRVRAYLPASGSILTGEVTDVLIESRGRSLRVIPDGLLESVIIREGVWIVDDL